MEPLDIEKALHGHPVRLRNGEKAYIRHKEVELRNCMELVGYRELNSGAYVLARWIKDGESTLSEDLDIVGMWKAAPLVFLYWGEIKRVFNYIAKDKDGEWWAYAEKPTKRSSIYDSSNGTDRTPLRALSTEVFPDCDWNESLMERPR